jgi:hypothetical protein
MTGFENEIRSMFELATTGIEPSGEAKGRALRRARRRRTTHVALWSGTAILVLLGAFFLTDLRPATQGRGGDVAGSRDDLFHITPNQGGVIIGSGELGGEPWELSRKVKDDCLQLTTSGWSAAYCGAARRPLKVHEDGSGAALFVFGEAAPGVRNLEVRVTQDGVTTTTPLDLLPPPEALASSRRSWSKNGYFVTAVPSDADLAAVVGRWSGEPVYEVVVTPGGALGSLTTSVEAEVSCPSTLVLEEKVRAQARKLVAEIEASQEAASARKGKGRPSAGKAQRTDVPDASCDLGRPPPGRSSPQGSE